MLIDKSSFLFDVQSYHLQSTELPTHAKLCFLLLINRVTFEKCLRMARDTSK